LPALFTRVKGDDYLWHLLNMVTCCIESREVSHEKNRSGFRKAMSSSRRMTTNMLGPKMLFGTIALLALGACLPATLAEDVSRARTDEGGCVLVAWTSQPYVVSTTTGCSAADPCVHVNWTTTPPAVAPGEC
jgi:hypothetical protein